MCLKNVSFQICRPFFKSNWNHNVIRERASNLENVGVHLSVASQGALMAAPLSLVVTVKEKRDTCGDLALLPLSERYSVIKVVFKSCQQRPCYWLVRVQGSAMLWYVTFPLLFSPDWQTGLDAASVSLSWYAGILSGSREEEKVFVFFVIVFWFCSCQIIWHSLRTVAFL